MQKSGFALAMVLWISAILMASTIYLLGMYKKSVNNAFILNDKLQAELLCDTSIERLKFYALTGKFQGGGITNHLKNFPKKLSLKNQLQKIDNNISFKLNAGGQMFSIYSSNLSILDNLVKSYTHDTRNYIDPYMDWLDLDSSNLLNGAENGYYFIFTKAYKPSNRGVIQHPEELFLLKNFKDINKSIKKEIISNFHFVNAGGMNVEAISPENIRKYMKINDFEFLQLVQWYEKDFLKYKTFLKMHMKRNQLEGANETATKIIDGEIIVTYNKARVGKRVNLFFRTSYKRPYITYKNQLSYD
ncbi:hypothetical protein JHD50_10595 [Sulfurimonas sp. MAG313]|nr:hypothetical protein [Sulfurimonas sp. MAG313]MDF1881740.1 hypothetical protein [Sulfurimonas sp. MAG313]